MGAADDSGEVEEKLPHSVSRAHGNCASTTPLRVSN